MALTKNDISNALKNVGINYGDIVLVHSSFKSLGELQDGAETVVSGFLQAIGDDGTLVMPTFVQKDFENAYKTWHIDKESDTGYLTNYFRRRYGSYRSNQATHSVAAFGCLAKCLTETHGESGRRIGDMGDTPFAKDSPWEKMYQLNAKILLLGVDPIVITFRHYAEYCFMGECVEKLLAIGCHEDMVECLADHNKTGVWPHLYNRVLFPRLESMGYVARTKCGNAEIACIEAKVFVDYATDCLKNSDNEVLWRVDSAWDTDAYIEWYNKFRQIVSI